MNQLGDLVCEFCVYVMDVISDFSGLSYGLINVLFFIVLQPAAILAFMLSTAFCAAYKSSNKRVYKNATIVFVVLGCICILAVAVPVICSTVYLLSLT